MKKDELIDFMSKDDIEILNSIPTKSVFSKKLSKKNIENQYIIDSMTEKAGCLVLGLPPYHYILKHIELVWN